MPFNLPLFISRRLQSDRQQARPTLVIATIGVAVGVAIMLLAVAITIGFKAEIRSKIIGAAAHIRITNSYAAHTHSNAPLYISDTLRRELTDLHGVSQVSTYSETSGVMMTDNAFHGIQIKGVSQSYDTTFLHSCLKSGVLPHFGDEANSILISQTIADKLQLRAGDRVYTYFTNNEQLRTRRFHIAGIYQTNFSDIDDILVFTDQSTVNRINGYDSCQVNGVEIRVSNYEVMPALTNYLRARFNGQSDGHGGQFLVLNVEEQNVPLFAWLSLLDINVWVILGIIILVAGFTLISGLLIIILEQTSTIGVLKALGASNRLLRNTFLFVAMRLVGVGMLCGNAITLALYFAQRRWHLFTLDAETYYIDHVPMQLNLPIFLTLNAAVFIISMLMLLLPATTISKVSPAKSIKYE